MISRNASLRKQHAVPASTDVLRPRFKDTSVHFEKALDWVPGAAGEYLFSADTDR